VERHSFMEAKWSGDHSFMKALVRAYALVRVRVSRLFGGSHYVFNSLFSSYLHPLT
jgi:hypothetical protein